MNTVRKICESDERGTVHLDLPIGSPRRRVEVLVTWQMADEHLADAVQQNKRVELEALAGALADDPIVRPEQPVLESRVPFE